MVLSISVLPSSRARARGSVTAYLRTYATHALNVLKEEVGDLLPVRLLVVFVEEGVRQRLPRGQRKRSVAYIKAYGTRALKEAV